MKIELKAPFNNRWKYGYLVTNKEPRRNVILYNSHSDRSTISYARYLYSVDFGELLPDDVVVDHINGDKMDDRLENYQLISNTQNVRKAFNQLNTSQQLVLFQCGMCGIEFSKPRNKTHLVIKKKSSDYCSRVCAGKAQFAGKPLSVIIKVYRECLYDEKGRPIEGQPL